MFKIVNGLIFSVLILMHGILSANEEQSLTNHFLFIDSEGVLLDIDKKPIVDEKVYVDRMITSFQKLYENDNSYELVIYIHGGLNTFKNTLSRVNNSYKPMLKEKKFPIFVCWESGFVTNYMNHLFLLRDGELNAKIGIITSPIVLIEDVVRSIVRIPVSTYNTIFGQNSLMIKIKNKEEKNAQKSLSKLKNAEENIRFNFHTNSSQVGHKFTEFMTIINPVKLILSPFVDGLGTGAWHSMLRRTDMILFPQKSYDNGVVQTALVYFLEKWKSLGLLKNVKINLIGHSMGTIISNNILSRYSDLNYNNIVYMAAACKLKDIRHLIVPILEQNKKISFYNLSLSPYRDINENKYYDFIPRGSLLVWLDDFLGEVNSFEDKTAGYWFNIIRAAKVIFPKEIRRQVHLTRFGIKGDIPRNHGDFDDFVFWRERFWKDADNTKIESLDRRKKL